MSRKTQLLQIHTSTLSKTPHLASTTISHAVAHLEGKSGPQLYESDGRLGVDHVTPGADRLGQFHVRGGVILTLRLRHVARPAGHARSGQVSGGVREEGFSAVGAVLLK